MRRVLQCKHSFRGFFLTPDKNTFLNTDCFWALKLCFHCWHESTQILTWNLRRTITYLYVSASLQKEKQISISLQNPYGHLAHIKTFSAFSSPLHRFRTVRAVCSSLDGVRVIFFIKTQRERERKEGRKSGIFFLKVIYSHSEQKQLWFELRWSLDLEISCHRLVCVCGVGASPPSSIFIKMFFSLEASV